jgi:hypothetical protein
MALPKLPPSTSLKAKEAKAMLAGPGWSPDEPLSQALMARIWRHDDGRALTRFADGRCRLYASHGDLAAWFDAADRQARRGFRWEEEIPQGAAFPTEVPSLLRALSPLLGLEAPRSADALPDLRLVEAAVQRLGQQRVLTPEVLPAVVAYVGERIRRVVGGEWTTRDTGSGHEPMLMVRGRPCAVMGIYKEILEYDRHVSLEAFVDHHVRTQQAR